MLNAQEQNNVEVVERARKSMTEAKMKEALYAINRLILSEDESAPGGLADMMEDDEIVKLWYAKESLADALGMK